MYIYIIKYFRKYFILLFDIPIILIELCAPAKLNAKTSQQRDPYTVFRLRYASRQGSLDKIN